MSRIERTITRETGERVRIDVSAYIDFIHGIKYTVGVMHCEKGKRKFRGVVKECATPSEIHSVKLELWEKLKPVE